MPESGRYARHHVKFRQNAGMTDLSSFVLSRSQQKAEFFDFLDKNRLIFIVLSGRFERLERYFGVLF